MRNPITIITMALLWSGMSFAQETEQQITTEQEVKVGPAIPGGGEEKKKEKKWDHYIGIQANLLLKQIISLDNTAEVNNPYFLKHSFSHVNMKGMFNVAFGYAYSRDEDKDGFVSNLSDLSVKTGFGFAKALGKKFQLGYGLDVVFGSKSIQTITIVAFDFFGGGTDSTITTTRSSDLSYGGGLQASFTFNIARNVLVGTEASYYFIFTDSKLNVETERYFDDGFSPVAITTTTLNEQTKRGALSLTLPVSIFLIFHF